MIPVDCIVCGSCVADVLLRPVPLDRPVGKDHLIRVEPPLFSPGGIVSNAGIRLARWGFRTAALTYVGKDEWGTILRQRYASEDLATESLVEHSASPTSFSAVLIDPSGERSFLHSVGAPKLLERAFIETELLKYSPRYFLLGYYPFLPKIGDELPSMLQAIRQRGCRTALDAAGDGGGMELLEKALPHLDLYVPSYNEACHQTGETEPAKILQRFRATGTKALLGVKLGAKGALLQTVDEEFLTIPAIKPPAPVADTTGAGDAFCAGMIAGLLKGFSVQQAGNFAAAAGAVCVTEIGGSNGIWDFISTARLSGLTC